MTHKMYTLMRTDMASMTPGRAVAQGKHLAHEAVRKFDDSANLDDEIAASWVEWQNDTSSRCGTEIVLGATYRQITSLMEKLREFNNQYKGSWFYGWFTDPEYPLRDGDTVHIITDVLTCMFVFIPTDMPFNIDRDQWATVKETLVNLELY